MKQIVHSMENDCVVCMNKMQNKQVLGCGHDMCSDCFKSWKTSCLKDNSDFTCPCCRYVIERRKVVNDDMMIQLSYEDYERVVYGEEPSPYVGLELVDVGGNPTWRELLALQTNPLDEEVMDDNDYLVSYDDRYVETEYDSDSDSFVDYPDDDECEW